MTEWIITSSLMIVLVIALRFALKGRITLRLQYALWALVLVRLLIPFQLASSSISALSITEKLSPTLELSHAEPVVKLPLSQINAPESQHNTHTSQEPASPGPAALPEAPVSTEESRGEYPFNAKQSLHFVRLLGGGVLAICIAISNLRFSLHLRRSRKVTTPYGNRRVYYSSTADSPCLAGIFRPSIYLPESCLEHSETLTHVLAHEYAHYRHGDHIWSILRCVCLCLHWYNPLVWVAAWLSKVDGELASDESAIRELGENSRMDYGRTLITLTCRKPTLEYLISNATTMYGNQRTLKTRIKQIAKKPKTKWIALVLLIIGVTCINLVIFTGPSAKKITPASTPRFYDDGIQGSYLFTESGLYVWDYTAGETQLSYDMAKKSNHEVHFNDSKQIPTLPGVACRLTVGTEIYKDTVYNRLYVKPGPEGSGLSCATFVPIMDMEPWQNTEQPASGYYAYIHNDHQKDKLYLYFDGQGHGRLIQGNAQINVQVTSTTISVSRYHTIYYRITDSVLSTSIGTYIYQEDVLPYDTLPAQPIAPGEYKILGEIGKELDYPNNPHSLTIQTDGTGTLFYQDKEYSIRIQDNEVLIDDAVVEYYYNIMDTKYYLRVIMEDGSAVLIFQSKDLSG